MGQKSIHVHIVTYNSEQYLGRCIDSVLAQQVSSDFSIKLSVTDNASRDGAADIARSYGDSLEFFGNAENLGFCAAHNQGVARFLEDDSAAAFVCLNPDLVLEPAAISELFSALDYSKKIGLVTPLLYRANDNLERVSPVLIDAAGMELLSSLRHFDRGSNQNESSGLQEECEVFGGTGACLMLSKQAVKDLIIERSAYDIALYRIYPQLQQGAEKRPQLFDEAFFAYREDADLSWRAGLLGWRCKYVPSAKGDHRRVVLPSNRSELAKEMNCWSVRNRFLLQINNYHFANFWQAFLPGIILRNLIVLAGVFLVERSSLQGLVQVWKLRHRALEQRSFIASKMV